MKSVTFYDPGDLTFGIGAGATVDEVEKLTSPNRQMLPMDVAQRARATIGGVLASAAHGPMRGAYG
ncbi:MAG: FAD-binding protein, partial [Candidatus Limnocylindria bacterium]